MKKNSFSSNSDYLTFLAREKEFSDQIINNSRSMISIINRNYVYEKVNATFCEAHKSISECVIGKSLEDIWGSQTFGNILKSRIDSCLTGNVIKYEASFITPLLGKRYFEVVFRPLTDCSGEVTHVMAETFDINDIVRSKDTARQKEEELRKFETNLPVGFLRCDAAGNIIYANKAFFTIMAFPDGSTVTGKNFQDFYLEDGLLKMHLDQLFESSTKSFGNVAFINSGGKEILCRVNGFTGFDVSGISAFADFTLEDSSREVMLEKRLLQARKMETIGVLAGGIAHDFNNILSTISGYSEMLMEDLNPGTELSDKVSKIQNAVLKGQSVINQILTFSRQVEQEKIPVSVSAVLRETIGFVNSAVPSDIVMKHKISGKNLNVLADPTQLFRVFLNLMTNAIQAMEGSGGILSVNMEIIEGKLLQPELNKDIVADEYVLVTFSDTGSGMDSSVMERIFEPFFTTREVGKGTGLGLSVIQGIVTEMDGEIMVSSKKDKGSVFYVYLPVSKDYPDFSPDLLKKKKILFITGNKYESRILSIALKNKGFELIYISDRRKLGKTLADGSDKPDLIIYMSDSTHIQQEDLVGIIGSLKIFIPCILITDPSQNVSEEKLLNSGIIKQQLIKPVSLKEITGAIQFALDQR